MIFRKTLVLTLCLFLALLSPLNIRCVVITGQTSFDVKINGEDTKLTIAEVTAMANYDKLEFTEADKPVKEHKFGPTWTAWSLNPAEEYHIPKWSVTGNCGCYPQICGVSEGCDIGEWGCGSNRMSGASTIENIFFLYCTSRQHYCHTLRKDDGPSYESRYLTKRYTIALTSYGGPDEPVLTEEGNPAKLKYRIPGYTISNSLDAISYSYNARITGMEPRKQVDTAIYRYLQSEGKILLQEDLLTLKSKPIVQVNYTNSSCPWDPEKMYLDVNLTNNTLDKNADRTGFRAYIILKKAKQEKLTSLNRVDILGLKEPTEWNNEPTFDFLDPCNEQFFTLRKDEHGTYKVDIPPRQKLIYPDTICIAVNEEGANSRNHLVLYEHKLGTSDWIASEKFVGALSVDYLSTVNLKITTSSSTIKFNVPEHKITAEIHDEADPPFLKMTSEAAVVCTVYFSTKCTFTLPIGKNGQFYVNQPIENCGVWNEKVDYNCDGAFGSFHPPSKYTITPLRNIFEKTSTKGYANTVHNVKDNTSWTDNFWKWWNDLTWPNLGATIWSWIVGLLKWALIILALGLFVVSAVLLIYQYILKLPGQLLWSFIKSLFSREAKPEQAKKKESSQSKKKGGYSEQSQDDSMYDDDRT